MFDFHMHSTVSFDGHHSPQQMVQAAVDAGLREICFTDHIDYVPEVETQTMAFAVQDYNAAYIDLQEESLAIRLGMEFGLMPDNRSVFEEYLAQRPYDFVLGSIHFVRGEDIYFPTYWQGKTVEQAERQFLEETLACVKNHDSFDVLAHLTYIGKARAHIARRPVPYEVYRELIDEILRTLAQKGKGLELNTSGVDRCGAFLPEAVYFRRFKELGGQIVTVGSDAHTYDRVGQYTREGCALLKEIFGYVCTFQNRTPVFHKL